MGLGKNLKKLGFSKLEIKVYQFLLAKKGQTARKIAQKTGIRVEAVYRLVKNLKNKGFITAVGKHPAVFYPLPPETGLSKLLQDFRQIAQKIVGTKKMAAFSSPLKIITNRKKYHQIGQKNLSQAKKEVLSLVSGTGELGPDFVKAMVETVKAKVNYKILASNFDSSNQEKLKNWQKNNFQVRFRAGEDINLNIFDRQVIQIGTRIQKDSREKWGLVMINQSLGQFLGEFFDFLWKNSQKI